MGVQVGPAVDRIVLPGEVDPDPENDRELHVSHRRCFVPPHPHVGPFMQQWDNATEASSWLQSPSVMAAGGAGKRLWAAAAVQEAPRPVPGRCCTDAPPRAGAGNLSFRQSLLYTHCGRMLEVGSCTAQRGRGV